MESQVAPLQWWIQLVDSSPLENHDELRDALRWFTGAERYRYIWDETNPTPTAIVAQGNGPPPDIFKCLKDVQPLMGRNEYMVFIMIVEADTLDQSAIYHVVVAKHTIAKVETGRELLAKAKATVLDVDEELAAGS